MFLTGSKQTKWVHASYLPEPNPSITPVKSGVTDVIILSWSIISTVLQRFFPIATDHVTFLDLCNRVGVVYA